MSYEIHLNIPEDSQPLKRSTPEALFGILADAPEVAEAIRKLANERRSQAFGNP